MSLSYHYPRTSPQILSQLQTGPRVEVDLAAEGRVLVHTKHNCCVLLSGSDLFLCSEHHPQVGYFPDPFGLHKQYQKRVLLCILTPHFHVQLEPGTYELLAKYQSNTCPNTSVREVHIYLSEVVDNQGK